MLLVILCDNALPLKCKFKKCCDTEGYRVDVPTLS